MSEILLLTATTGWGDYPTANANLAIPKAAYPALNKSADSIAGLLPNGWKIEVEKTGDLNGDGMADSVFVFRQNSEDNFVKNPGGFGEHRLDTNPRILGVAFRDKKSGRYNTVMNNHVLIPGREKPELSDPLNEVLLEKGVFSVNVGYFASTGSADMWNSKYTFKYSDNCFRLIGYDYIYVKRNTADLVDISINYLSGKASITTGDRETGKESVKWVKAPVGRRICIQDIGNGLEYETGLKFDLPY